MVDDKHTESGSGRFPPDLGAVLAPILISIIVLYLIGAMEQARAFGDRSLFLIALWLGGIGSLLLFVARLPLYRQQHFFTLGPRSLTGIYRKLYYAAYVFILLSVALLVLLLFGLK